MKTFISNISNIEFPETEKVNAKIIRKSIFDLIQKDHPNFSRQSHISISELNQYRQKYIAEYLINDVLQNGYDHEYGGPRSFQRML